MNYSEIAFEAAFGRENELPPSCCPEVCFSGRSNVGKSSLINRVVGRRAIARVSTRPGKTVTVNFYRAGDVRLVDLPGYGYARTSHSEKRRWSGLMEGYFRSERDIRLVLQLFDMRREPTPDDLDMVKFLKSANIPFLPILTKSDKLNRSEYAALLSVYLELFGEVVTTSSLTGEGVDAVRNAIDEATL